jgi:hypothetical protein
VLEDPALNTRDRLLELVELAGFGREGNR